MREDFNNKNSIFNSERMSLNQIIEGLKNENEKLRLDKVELSDQLKETKERNRKRERIRRNKYECI